MSECLSILHVTAEYGPCQTGGLGSLVSNLVAYQRKSWRVEVALLNDASIGNLGDGVFPCATENQYAALVARHAAEPYDILHFHDWQGWKFARALEGNRSPLVLTCHLPCHRHSYDTEHSHNESVEAESYLFHRAENIVGNSKFTTREIVGKSPEHAFKLFTIHNGIDMEYFFPDAAVERDGALVFAAGRLVPQKGFGYFIEACARVKKCMPDTKFALAGDGPLSGQFEAQVRSMNLCGAFVFLGHADQKTLRNYYRRCAMTVVPSDYEPFGLVAAEAMACGSAVIGSDAGGLREVIEHGHSGLAVKVGDIDAISAAIVFLRTRQHARTLLGRRAARSVSDKFSMVRCEDAYRRLYLELRSRRGTR